MLGLKQSALVQGTIMPTILIFCIWWLWRGIIFHNMQGTSPRNVHIPVLKWCIVGHDTGALWDLSSLDFSTGLSHAWCQAITLTHEDTCILSIIFKLHCVMKFSIWKYMYRKTSNISCTLVGNKIVDHSDVVGASSVGAAPTTSSFSTWYLASRDSAKKVARQYENLLSVGIWCALY